MNYTTYTMSGSKGLYLFINKNYGYIGALTLMLPSMMGSYFQLAKSPGLGATTALITSKNPAEFQISFSFGYGTETIYVYKIN